MNLTHFFDKLNKISLYLLLFLIPVFFLPFTQNVLDFPKQILASVLILLSLIGWLGKSIIEGRVVLRGDKIFYISLILIFVSLLFSFIFSLWPELSFWGHYLAPADSFLSLFLFLIFAFLIVNSFKTGVEFLTLLFPLLLSGAIAGVIGILQLYNVFILPFNFAGISSFNTVGTINSLAIFSAAVLPLSLILFFKGKGALKIILGIISFIFFISVLLINFKTAWICLMAAILVLFIFGFNSQKSKNKTAWAVLLMIGLIFSIFFYFFPARLPGFPVLPLEVSLTFNSEAHILKGAFDQGAKNIFLGTGPGTFIFSYSQHRSSLLNQTLFWGTRFSNGHSYFMDWILTKGILGGASLIFLYYLIINFLFKYLKKFGDKEDFFEIKLGLTAGLLGLIIAGFLYPFNFILHFIFWFFIGGFFIFFSSKLKVISLFFESSVNTEAEKKQNLLDYPKMVLSNLILIAVIISGLSLVFLFWQKYYAEINYLKGVENSETENFDRAIGYFHQAIRLNPSSDLYQRDLSQIYLAKANLILQNPDLSFEDKRSLANLAIIDGAEAINQAVEIAPINVANWNVRGFFYRNLIGVEGAVELSLESYQKATQLEPSSPFAFGEKGRVYILTAQDLAQKGQEELSMEKLDAALENLNRAIALKPDYASAHYLAAVAYDQQGNLEQAILKLNEIKTISPQDSGVAFQLGLLYWRAQELNEAREELQRAVNLNPDYSNARYILGLVYEKQGEKEKAKEEFKKVAQLNPENQEINKILENIEKGLPALEDITFFEPPIQETPPEIQQ